jgi:hypothetical protein
LGLTNFQPRFAIVREAVLHIAFLSLRLLSFVREKKERGEEVHVKEEEGERSAKGPGD